MYQSGYIIFFGQSKYWVGEKSLFPKKYLIKMKFWSQQILGRKKGWSQKMLCPEIFLFPETPREKPSYQGQDTLTGAH